MCVRVKKERKKEKEGKGQVCMGWKDGVGKQTNK